MDDFNTGMHTMFKLKAISGLNPYGDKKKYTPHHHLRETKASESCFMDIISDSVDCERSAVSFFFNVYHFQCGLAWRE